MMLGVGIGLPITAIGKGAAPVDPTLLLYDKFDRAPGAIEGRKPVVGPNWRVSGPQAADVSVSGGYMRMSGPGNAYVITNGSLGETPGSFECVFLWGGGAQPPVISSFRDGTPTPPDFSDVAMAHMFLAPTAFSPEWLEEAWFNDQLANHPPQWRGPLSTFALTSGQKYRFRIDWQAGWCMMRLWNMSGTLLGQAQSYDSRWETVRGPYAFFQLFDASMMYEEVWIRKAATITVPTLTKALDTYFPGSKPGAIVNSPYGAGSSAYVATNQLQINCDASQGSGAAVNIGSVTSGKTVRVVIDVVSATVPFIAALVPAGGGLPISAFSSLISAAGRYVIDLAATGSNASALAVLGGFGATPGNMVIKSWFTVNDGPTGFVTL